jgi:hypothetical protein
MSVSLSVKDSRYMKICFNNGTERSFAFEPLVETIDPSNLLTFIHKALDSRRLVLQTQDEMIIIPFDNILTIEVAPTMGKGLPEAIHVLHEFTGAEIPY